MKGTLEGHDERYGGWLHREQLRQRVSYFMDNLIGTIQTGQKGNDGRLAVTERGEGANVKTEAGQAQ